MHMLCVTRRKLQTPGNAEEHRRHETPTINPIGPTDKPMLCVPQHAYDNTQVSSSIEGDLNLELTSLIRIRSMDAYSCVLGGRDSALKINALG